MSTYFNDLLTRGLPASVLPTDGPPVMSVYLNLDKCFAFVEMPSVDITTAWDPPSQRLQSRADASQQRRSTAI